MSRPKLSSDPVADHEAALARGEGTSVKLGKLSDLKKGKNTAAQGSSSTVSESITSSSIAEKDIVEIASPFQMPSEGPKPVAAKKKSLFAQRQKGNETPTPNQLPSAPTPDKATVSVFADIHEREADPSQIRAPAPRAGSFPEAIHRDAQSNFAPAPQVQARPAISAAKPSLSASTASSSGDSQDAEALNPHSASFQRMRQEIEEENAKTISKMTKFEITQAQQELFSQLDPKLLELLKKRVAKKVGTAQTQVQTQSSQGSTSSAGGSVGNLVAPRSADMTSERPAAKVGRTAPPPIIRSSDKKKKTTIVEGLDEEDPHAALKRMSRTAPQAQSQFGKAISPAEAALEQLKQQWMDPVSEKEKTDAKKRPRSTLEAEAYRFDFDGNLLVFPHTKEGLVELTAWGKQTKKTAKDDTVLYHHGEEAALPGYNLPELARLARSHLPGQRQGALRALEYVIRNAKNCKFYVPQYKDERVIVSSLLLNYLDKECDIGLMLRTAIDDPNVTTAITGVRALHSFICNEFDEPLFSIVDQSWKGHESIFTTPKRLQNMAKRPGEDDEATDSDSQRIQNDIIMGLIETGLLGRLRFLLDVSPVPDDVRELILQILLAVARHSDAAATHFVKCPHLLEAIEERYLTKPVNEQTSYAIRCLRAAAQSSRRVAFVIISKKLISHTGLFLVPEIEKWSLKGTGLATIPAVNPASIVACAECLKLLNVLVRYRFNEVSSFVHTLLPTFIALLAANSNENRHPMRELLRGHIMQLYEGLAEVAVDPAGGGSTAVNTFALRWNHVSPLLPIALSRLSSSNQHYSEAASTNTAVVQYYDEEDEEEEMTRPPLMLLSWLLHFIATYLEALPHRATPTKTSDELPRFEQIASKYIIPFIDSPIVHDALVVLSSDRDAWLNNEVVLGNLAQACYTLDNTPNLCWPELIRHHSAADAPEPSTPLPEIRCRDFLLRCNLLLGLSRVIDALSAASSPSRAESLVNFLKSVEGQLGLLSPLSRIVNLYNDVEVGQRLPMGVGALFASRTLQHLIGRILQYMPASLATERVDATLQIISRLLPGDEDLFEALVEGILKPQNTPDAADAPKPLISNSNAQILEFFKEIAAIRAVDEFEEDEEEDEELAAVTARLPRSEDEDMMRPGFAIPIDRSLLPLGRTWLYSPIRRFREFETIAEAQEEDTAESMTEKQKATASIRFIRDSVALVRALEATGKLKFLSSIPSDVKLYSMMQVFLLPSEIYMDSSVSAEIDGWLDSFISAGHHIPLLSFGFHLDVGLVEKLTQAWSLHSFAHNTPGRFVSLFLFAGSLSTESNPLEKHPQRFDELEASLKHIGGALELMWNRLPLPPMTEAQRFKCAFQPTAPMQKRLFLAEYFLRCLKLPQCAHVLSGKNASPSERFLLAVIMHWTSSFLFGENKVALFAREQLLEQLISSNLDSRVLSTILTWNSHKNIQDADWFAPASDLADRRELLAKFAHVPAVSGLLQK
eukprot:TRINITY_DN4032_c0_g1_i3.p1 TRINITY_DN4032_c0_g1~~TRINITY_DN4032_c0_g1_i3.p1  ORF type:complete len:1481 (+),score=326.07 TRINITY_DN4032_c0_g1_i3:13-4455(+)